MVGLRETGRVVGTLGELEGWVVDRKTGVVDGTKGPRLGGVKGSPRASGV